MEEALSLYLGQPWGLIAWGVINVVFSIIAGTLGYLSRTCSSESPVLFNSNRMLIEAGSSGFVGLLVLMMCSVSNLGGAATGLCVGFFGWVGAPATIVVLEKFVFRLIGIVKHESTKSD
ncbi:phage holin family protein [Methylovorus glucosotrophus]|uniref:Transmembrane protein n=1 Tax=Methylovorus glucosotrophus (strain SIP3-4) TaxID=582744 RepID=C6XE80_METGS|nr:phage holin family protein [Methylovorus glucosotrophus]ACT50855.1 conserved hypothetical protein [Methylovorus glucosotrophus SIP3-4]